MAVERRHYGGQSPASEDTKHQLNHDRPCLTATDAQAWERADLAGAARHQAMETGNRPFPQATRHLVRGATLPSPPPRRRCMVMS